MRAGDRESRTIVPCSYGDAAFAGQGIVAETLNLCHLVGYSTGGTLHVVVNNQIGFTTTPSEARSTLYCTDVAKMIQVPIFHVNGDDPEAVIHCVTIAMEYRERFGEDVVIDMVCYRRHGHNEGDEPAFTQPLLYEKIRRLPGVRRLYTERLLKLGLLRQEDVERIEADLNGQLAAALERIKTKSPERDEPYEPHGPWTGFSRELPAEEIDTGVSIERLAQLAEGLGSVPSGFRVHPKLASLLEKRSKVVADNGAVDWALGEALAFGSLVVEGTPVRLSGQDSTRGTFSHRHAAVTDQQTGEEYCSLDHLSATQARFEVYDSHLSEAAVLGFEYGYSLADPKTLVLWEAQFGDFANGAQVVIDQFIAARLEVGTHGDLVMLLPHGYEGQGRAFGGIERYLIAPRTICRSRARRPRSIFTSCAARCGATIGAADPVHAEESARARGRRQLEKRADAGLLDDAQTNAAPDAVRRVLYCSGKVFYDLLEAREKRAAANGGVRDVAILRVEQLYPWPDDRVAQQDERYARAERIVWVQEEPANMGGFSFARERLQDSLRPHQQLAYAGRPESASTAVGSLRLHRQQQAALVAAAFSGL